MFLTKLLKNIGQSTDIFYLTQNIVFKNKQIKQLCTMLYSISSRNLSRTEV